MGVVPKAAAGCEGESDARCVTAGLEKLDAALGSQSRPGIAALFSPEGHCRDVLALIWDLTPPQGADSIAYLLASMQSTARVVDSRWHGAARPRDVSNAPGSM